MIEINHLSRRRRTGWALRDVSFTARPGRVTGLVGPNGAGKSSTLRILLGLDRADAGTATVAGRPYRSLPAPLRTVGASLEGSGAHRSRTARAHLSWLASSNGIPRSRVDEVLVEVGLGDAARRRVGGYSLGMGQRLGVAAALLGDPAILVLDEPANGLDPVGIRWLRRLLRDQADRGRTVLLSSHQMGELEEVADDLVVMADGTVVAAGTTAGIVSGHGGLEAAFFALVDGREEGRDGATGPQ